MNTKSRSEELKKIRAEKLDETKTWAAARFKVPVSEIVGYNSGSAYDKVWVRSRATAEKIAAQLKGETCNGGWFDGMPLGGISEYDGAFEVMC